MQPKRYARALESAASCVGVIVDSWVVVNARICVAFNASNSKFFSVSESMTDCDHVAMLVVVMPLIWVAVIIAICVVVIALICSPFKPPNCVGVSCCNCVAERLVSSVADRLPIWAGVSAANCVVVSAASCSVLSERIWARLRACICCVLSNAICDVERLSISVVVKALTCVAVSPASWVWVMPCIMLAVSPVIPVVDKAAIWLELSAWNWAIAPTCSDVSPYSSSSVSSDIYEGVRLAICVAEKPLMPVAERLVNCVVVRAAIWVFVRPDTAEEESA